VFTAWRYEQGPAWPRLHRQPSNTGIGRWAYISRSKSRTTCAADDWSRSRQWRNALGLSQHEAGRCWCHAAQQRQQVYREGADGPRLGRCGRVCRQASKRLSPRRVAACVVSSGLCSQQQGQLQTLMHDAMPGCRGSQKTWECVGSVMLGGTQSRNDGAASPQGTR
jgi:hypothetical protein